MGSYRTRLDIIADILNVAKESAKKTRIMYQANLSYKLLARYLTEIKQACLIHFDHKERCYVLTDKGKEFLVKYEEYSRCNRHVEKQLTDLQEKKKLLRGLCPSN